MQGSLFRYASKQGNIAFRSGAAVRNPTMHLVIAHDMQELQLVRSHSHTYLICLCLQEHTGGTSCWSAVSATPCSLQTTPPF